MIGDLVQRRVDGAEMLLLKRRWGVAHSFNSMYLPLPILRMCILLMHLFIYVITLFTLFVWLIWHVVGIQLSRSNIISSGVWSKMWNRAKVVDTL